MQMNNLLQLILVSAMLVSCGGESSTSSNTNEESTTISKVDKKPINTCEILEKSIKASFNDATELEKSRDLVTEMMIKNNPNYKSKKCGYRFKSQSAVFDVHVDLWKVHSKYATDEALIKKVSYLNATKTEEVKGAGEKAFADTQSNRLVAMKNKSIIEARVRCVGDPQCSEGKAIVITLTNGIFESLDE